MKKNITTIIFLFSISLLNAQDTQLLWAKQLGRNGTNASRNKSIVLDAQGNIYTAGSFLGTGDFNPDLTATFNLTSVDNFHPSFYISKFDSNGNFIWAKQIKSGSGTTDYVICNAIALDANDNIVLTGNFSGTIDFDPDAGVQLINSGTTTTSAFVLKLNNSAEFIFASPYGDSGVCMSNSLVVDSESNIYISGNFDRTATFDGVNQLATHITYYPNGVDIYSIAQEIYLLKLDSNGAFLWVNQFKSSGTNDKSWYPRLSIDNANNVYMLGEYRGIYDFDSSPDAIQNLTSNPVLDTTLPANDVFIAKYNTDGNYQWAKSFGGLSYDTPRCLTTDSQGNVLYAAQFYTDGGFYGPIDFDPDPISTYFLSGVFYYDVISKLDTDGNFQWVKQFDYPQSTYDAIGIGNLALDSSGNIYAFGGYHGTMDFNPDPTQTFTLTSLVANNGSPMPGDSFILKLDNLGDFLWAKSIGGNREDESKSIVVDVDNNILCTGTFRFTADFDPESSEYNLTSQNDEYHSQDFILKLSQPNLSVNQNTIQNSLVFPNPVNDILNINCSKEISKISIYNILGQEVLVKNSISNQSQIDMSTLLSGTYMVKITTDEEVKIVKVIKK